MLRSPLAVTARVARRAASSRLPTYSAPAGITLVRGLTTKDKDTVALKDLYDFGLPHVNKGVSRMTEGIMASGQGAYVTYEDGRTMLDFTCGIGVTNLGHAHPKVSGAAADQCMRLVHSQCSIALHEPYLRLIERLLPIMPHPSLDSFFFWNSGSEAVEAAIKMARQITGKQNIICMQGAYHGRTFGAMALTKSKTVYAHGVSPLMPGVYSIPYPHFHQLGASPSTPSSELTAHCLYQLDLLLAQQTAPSDTAAIIIEPVLGEGGYVPAPPEFLQGLREVCDKHNILLIIDEVQSGMGRAGGLPFEHANNTPVHGQGFFSIEESGVKPDILIIAKGLGNGFPISGVVSSKELTDQLKPGSMGGTYAGNAVSCAAAIAVVDTMHEDQIIENVTARSHELISALGTLKYDPSLNPHILDVRGKGLMVGVEFRSPSNPGLKYDPLYGPSATSPANGSTNGDAGLVANIAARVSKRCAEKGMLILTTSVYEVIRFIPPLNITKEELAKGCAIFSEALREVVKEG